MDDCHAVATAGCHNKV